MHNFAAKLILTGLLACLVSATTLSQSQAQTTSSTPSGGVVLRAPAAPSGASAIAQALATSPRISPAVSTTHVPARGTFTCYYGDLCPAVWDPTTGTFKVFFLYTCARYSVSYWGGSGGFADNQTPGTRSYFYGSTGGVLKSFLAPSSGSQNWDPVYSVRNC